MKKESNRLKAKKSDFLYEVGFLGETGKKGFFWPVITMAEVYKYCLKNIVTFLLLSTIKNIILMHIKLLHQRQVFTFTNKRLLLLAYSIVF